MGKGTVAALGAVASWLIVVQLAACGLDKAGESSGAADATAPGVDAGSDAAPLDGAADVAPEMDASDADAAMGDDADAGCGALLSCGGKCVSSCAQCPGSPVLCTASRACLADCKACAALGSGITCFSCAGGGAPIGFCASSAASCPNAPPGACACDVDAGVCPGADQACVLPGGDAGDDAGSCLTCGQAGTGGVMCTGGGVCTVSTGECTL